MADKSVEVEVLDRDGRPVSLATTEKKHSLAFPVNVLIFMLALLTAVGIVFLAVGHLLEERARKLLDREKDPE